MKKRIISALLLVSLTLPLVGCRPASDGGAAEPQQEKSSTRLLVEGVTGKSAVDAGARAKAEIEAIAEQQNARLDEVLEE